MSFRFRRLQQKKRKLALIVDTANNNKLAITFPSAVLTSAFIASKRDVLTARLANEKYFYKFLTTISCFN